MEAAKLWDPEELLAGPGIVDYVVGAAPGPGVFVLGTIEHPRQRHYLNLYKLGEGPIYCFHTPYHLCHFEVPTTHRPRRALRRRGDRPARRAASRGGGGRQARPQGRRGDRRARRLSRLRRGRGGGGDRAGRAPADRRRGRREARGATSPRTRCSPTPTWSCPEGRLVDKLRAEQAALFGLARSAA